MISGPSNADPVILMSGLHKRREKSDARFDLVVPALIIPRGAIVAITGDSGCGKSTLLDLIALVLRPDTVDDFLVRGEDGDEANAMMLWDEGGDRALARFRRRSMGYVLQTGGLFPFLDVRANASLPFSLRGERPDAELITTLAARLGIKDQLGSKPAQLSGGQRQRAAVLRALAVNPPIILADEPTAALDRRNAVRVLKPLADLARTRGATVLIVTHQPDLIAEFADIQVRFDLEYPKKGHVVSTCISSEPAAAA